MAFQIDLSEQADVSHRVRISIIIKIKIARKTKPQRSLLETWKAGLSTQKPIQYKAIEPTFIEQIV